MTTTFTVAGMTCSHCIHAVSEELGRLSGVTGVDVDLVAGGESRVRVTGDRAVAEDDARAAVAEAGYELTGVLA